MFAFMLDERTVVEWHTRVGRPAKRVQAELVCQGHLEVGQVQGDELYVKTQQGPVWMATAMCVFSRLFIWGEVSAVRNTALVQRVVVRVRAAARRLIALEQRVRLGTWAAAQEIMCCWPAAMQTRPPA